MPPLPPSSPTKRGPTLDQLAHRYAPSFTPAPPSPDRPKRRLELAGRLAPDAQHASRPHAPAEGAHLPAPLEPTASAAAADDDDDDDAAPARTIRRPGESLTLDLADQRAAHDAGHPLSSTVGASSARSPPASPTRLEGAAASGSASSSAGASVPLPRPPSPVKPTKTNEGQVGPDGSVSHPLTEPWTLYFDSTTWNPSEASTPDSAEASRRRLPYPTVAGASRAPGAVDHASSGGRHHTSDQGPWAASLKNLGTFRTVEAFFGTFKTLRRPSSLGHADRAAGTVASGGSSSYHLFKRGVTPAREDRVNARGGRWTFTLPVSNAALLDRSWTWLVLALIGEQLAPETVTEDEDDMDLVTGAVVTVRPGSLHRLALWVRRYDAPSVAALNRLARRAVEEMDLASVAGVRVQFTPHAKPATWDTDKDVFWSLVVTPGSTDAVGSPSAPATRPSADAAGSWRSG